MTRPLENRFFPSSQSPVASSQTRSRRGNEAGAKETPVPSSKFPVSHATPSGTDGWIPHARFAQDAKTPRQNTSGVHFASLRLCVSHLPHHERNRRPPIWCLETQNSQLKAACPHAARVRYQFPDPDHGYNGFHGWAGLEAGFSSWLIVHLARGQRSQAKSLLIRVIRAIRGFLGSGNWEL